MDSAPPSPSPPRRVRKRIVLPAVAIAVLILLFGGIWLRGTVASAEEKNPASSTEGVLTQLYLARDGRKVVRCAVVLDRPMEEVWKAVSDYDNFERIFPTIEEVRTNVEPDGRHRLQCNVTSILGTWPIDVRIRHESSPERRTASWDEPTGNVIVNRGSWTLSPADQGKTLVIYTLDVEVRPFPDALVRAVLLSRQKTVVEALARHLDKPSR
jgi:uncharacterized membrane protein